MHGERVSAKGVGAAKWGMNIRLYRQGFVIAAVAVLGIAAYRIFEPFWGALAWAVCLAFLLAPLQSWLTRRLRGRAGTAAGLITALTPFVIFGPLTVLGLVFANQVSTLVNALQRSPLRIDSGLLVRIQQWPIVGRATAWISDNATISAEQVQGWIVGAAQGALKSVAAAGGNVVLGAIGTLVGFFLMLFLLFFLLRDGRAMLARAVRLIPLDKRRRDPLLTLVGNTTRAVVYGTGITALVQGALVAIGFSIAGLSSPIVFGVFAAVLALLPAGGAAIVWIPGVIWLAATSQWGYAIFLLVWGIVVSVSDNLVRPMLIRNRAPVSTLAVFIGVVGGVAAFGAVGVIAGPVLLTLIGALLRFVDDPQEPQDTVDSEPPP